MKWSKCDEMVVEVEMGR